MESRGDPPRLGRGVKLSYGVGQAAEGLKNASFAVFLFFYYTAVLGVSPTLVGAALFVALLFDAVTDPLAGYLSDRWRSRWGRRHPFMLAAAIPLAIAFTLETDGRLPSGQALGEAIAQVDAAGGQKPLYYMINCAHPDHFHEILDGNAAWASRIGGIRATASRMSHAELDACESLDDGDPQELAALNADILARLPGIRVVGGCCGTDHRHVGCIASHRHESVSDMAEV